MNTLRKLGLILGLSALLPLAAFAAGTATVKTSDGQTWKAAWLNDNTVRVDQGNSDKYMVMREGEIYSVSHENGHPRVMKVGGMLKAFAQIAESSDKEFRPPKITSLKDTGKSETVAGIRGEVYRITLNYNGESRTTDAVLTDNPLAVELTGVYLHTVNTVLDDDLGTKFMAQLPPRRRGILRVGDDFVLQSIADDKPSADLFNLPAKPTSITDLFKNMAKQLQQQQ